MKIFGVGLICLASLSLLVVGVSSSDALIAWVREQGGFVHEFVSLDLINTEESDKGIVVATANQHLASQTVLLKIPRQLAIGGESNDFCETVETIAAQLDDATNANVFVRHLQETVIASTPSTWSKAGRALLRQLLEDDLPPMDVDQMTYLHICEQISANHEHAFALLSQLGLDDSYVIPLLDSFQQHDNAANARVEIAADAFFVRANQDVAAGERLRYNPTVDDVGTPEVFRDYGFIETYPQRWVFTKTLAFDLNRDDAGWFVTWIKGEPREADMNFIEDRLPRLQSFTAMNLQTNTYNIPATEWELIQQYHAALVLALSQAFKEASSILVNTSSCMVGQDGTVVCEERATSFVDDIEDDSGDEDDEDVMDEYDPFVKIEADFTYHDTSCAKGGKNMPSYEALQHLASQYQKIYFYHDPDDNDVCFDLDNIVQICGSYRPHYHEAVVHYTARYLNTVKRVLFVGGGDSMLLHEILKYPSLEKVVGLELDQVVTRASFRHFGTMPHWHHEKVEWWYGDAAKSLLMLPKDYFGSFDMVLVDLSETVMSMTVNRGLDIFGALSLLLQPKGIIVKNELYLDKFGELFDYTTQLHLHDWPVVCTQALILGSYENDMLHANPTDHGIGDKNLYAKGEDSMARYEHWHDFRKNHTQFGGYCTQKEEFEKEPETQEKSPGILMILEAEDATNLSSMEDAKASITATLKAAGMGVISISEDSFEKLGTLIFVLEEGYVTVRLWFEHKYVAFDVHLWSRFEMHERIKQALVTAVGSDSVSQYRIVAGGMFGISTWKEDEKNRGPKFTRPCVKEGGVSSLDTLGNVDEGAVKVLFAEALGLLDEGVVTAIAVCGTKLQSCLALDAMNELENVKTFPIYACVQSSVFSEMSACERKTFDMISALVDENGSKVGAIVLDDNAPKPMAQIIHSIFSKKAYRMRLLTTKLTVVTVLTNDAESWRVEFLERFRIFVPEPGYRTSIKFASSRSNIELGIVAAGNPMFFETIQSKIKKMEAKTGLTADLDSIEGSIFDLHKYTSPDYQAPNFFLPTDYNQTEALWQFLTQTPLGYQVVFQLEPGFDPAHVSKDKVVRPGDRIIVEWNDEEDYLATVIARNIDGTYRIEYDVGDIDDAMDRGEFTKLETQEERDASVHLSSATVEEAMMSALGMGGLSTKTSSVKMFAIGDGCIVVATFEGGNAVALWDGKVHVDLNVFTYNEDPGFVHAFEATFQNVVSPLSILLRDEQPRGIRHVVNFKRDIGDNDGPREQPHWALHLPALKLSES